MTDAEVLERTRDAIDPLTNERRAEMTAALLKQLAEQLFDLELIQASNAHGDDEPIPANTPTGTLPDAKTYGERKTELTSGLDNIRAKISPGVLTRAEEILLSEKKPEEK